MHNHNINNYCCFLFFFSPKQKHQSQSHHHQLVCYLHYTVYVCIFQLLIVIEFVHYTVHKINTSTSLVRKSWTIDAKETSYKVVSKSSSFTHLKTSASDGKNNNLVLLCVTGKNVDQYNIIYSYT